MLETLKDLFLFLPEAFIMFHTMGFEMIGEFSYELQNYGLGWAISWLFLGIIMIAMVLFVDGIMILGIYCLIRKISIMIRTKKITEQRVIGTVTYKKHIKEHTSVEYDVALKMPVSDYHSAEYKLYVEYNGVTATFDSKKMFEKYKKKDKIPLILIQNLDKNEIPIKQKLELPEW